MGPRALGSKEEGSNGPRAQGSKGQRVHGPRGPRVRGKGPRVKDLGSQGLRWGHGPRGGGPSGGQALFLKELFTLLDLCESFRRRGQLIFSVLFQF